MIYRISELSSCWYNIAILCSSSKTWNIRARVSYYHSASVPIHRPRPSIFYDLVACSRFYWSDAFRLVLVFCWNSCSVTFQAFGTMNGWGCEGLLRWTDRHTREATRAACPRSMASCRQDVDVSIVYNYTHAPLPRTNTLYCKGKM